MNALLAVSIGLTRRWVHVYTAGLPSESRFARRAEIESDLWEQMQEAARAGNPTSSTGLRVLGRMARGTWDDLSWRFATHGIERGASGFVFVALVVAGFALGFLIPGKPDFAASRDEMTAFYGGNLIAIYFGHALIWLSAAFFLRFLGNLRDALRTDPNHTGPDLLPAITFGLGVAACSLVVAAFALTVIAASLAKMGAGPQAIPALYPIAGYMFHYPASAAFAGTLAGVAASVALNSGIAGIVEVRHRRLRGCVGFGRCGSVHSLRRAVLSARVGTADQRHPDAWPRSRAGCGKPGLADEDILRGGLINNEQSAIRRRPAARRAQLRRRPSVPGGRKHRGCGRHCRQDRRRRRSAVGERCHGPRALGSIQVAAFAWPWHGRRRRLLRHLLLVDRGGSSHGCRRSVPGDQRVPAPSPRTSDGSVEAL